MKKNLKLNLSWLALIVVLFGIISKNKYFKSLLYPNFNGYRY